MAKNLKVVMTRTADVFIELSERAAISNRAGARIFVSIHLNAFNGSARGTETFLHNDSSASEPIARDVQANLVRELGLPDRGVKRANFSVLRNTYRNSLSVLTEAKFIDNAQDAAIIKSPDFIDKTAKAHADAIKKYSRDGDIICLDPGHGGSDPGATGHGIREKDVVLAIALKTRELLLDEPTIISRVDATIIYKGQRVSGFIEDGTTYAQMRELANLVGVPVNWNQETKQAYLGGHPVDGVIIDGRTYLPVRELANSIGLTVGWDQQTKTVTLSD